VLLELTDIALQRNEVRGRARLRSALLLTVISLGAPQKSSGRGGRAAAGTRSGEHTREGELPMPTGA
jgi:hypothetical protein